LGEAGGVDRLIEHEGRIDPVAAQRGDMPSFKTAATTRSRRSME
jgi:hypothetical protein